MGVSACGGYIAYAKAHKGKIKIVNSKGIKKGCVRYPYRGHCFNLAERDVRLLALSCNARTLAYCRSEDLDIRIVDIPQPNSASDGQEGPPIAAEAKALLSDSRHSLKDDQGTVGEQHPADANGMTVPEEQAGDEGASLRSIETVIPAQATVDSTSNQSNTGDN